MALEVSSGATGGRVPAMDTRRIHSSLTSDSSDVKRAWPPAMYQMMDTGGDFPPRTHHLSRW